MTLWKSLKMALKSVKKKQQIQNEVTHAKLHQDLIPSLDCLVEFILNQSVWNCLACSSEVRLDKTPCFLREGNLT